MVECLSLLSIGAACVGNHDLDLGAPPRLPCSAARRAPARVRKAAWGKRRA